LENKTKNSMANGCLLQFKPELKLVN